MCGISATIQLNAPTNCTRRDANTTSVNGSGVNGSYSTRLKRSLDVIRHRGPDAIGTWVSHDQRVGLGHVRLSIVDLSPEGNQPFVGFDDEIVAVVNGELYGHETYRKKLQKEYEFQGQSDCEIVMALYKHYGVSFVSHLRGEFAFVLWDSKRELLLAGRDRYGIKSLYYTIQGNQLLLATEMKSFLEFGWQPEWCVETLRCLAWKCGRKTFFRNVYKILPGHYLLCQNFEPDVHQVMYWDTEFPDKHILQTRPEVEMIEGVRSRLIEAVRLRLRADVPIGIFLSGGLDSSCIAGIVAHLIAQEGTQLGSDASGDLSRLHCFTVQFDKESGCDESDIARRTADSLGVRFHLIEANEHTLAARFEDAVWFSETPFPDVNGVSRLAMAEKVHTMGIKVVLTGEGSDEHFGGYTDFRPDAIQEPDLSWPPSRFSDVERDTAWRETCENTGAIVFGDGILQVPKSTSRMANHTRTIRELAKIGGMPFAAWTDRYLSVGDPETLLAEAMDGRVRQMMATKWHPLHTSAYTWMKSFLVTFILRYCGDNIDMAHSVESRLPFLDHYLTEYANQLPPSLKMKFDPQTNSFREKYILREAVRPFVTEEVYNGRKKGYCGPTQYREGGPLHQTLQRLLTRENLEQLGFVHVPSSQKHLDSAFRQGDRTAFRNSMLIAQFVVLSQRFGVKPATPHSF